MYKVGDIFYVDNEYAARAQFCNENGLTIAEIASDEIGRRFEIVEPPQPTEAELAQREIMQLEAWFVEYDKETAQYYRCQRLGIEYDKDINELDKQAQINQLRIRELRAQLV